MDIHYVHDALGRRIGKIRDGNLEKGWLYADALNPIAELDSSGNIEATFIYGSRAHVPDAMVMTNGTVYRFITDHLGSVRLVVNAATGDVVQRMDYDAFGRVLNDTSPGFQPFGFAGCLYDDDTGLVRFGARDYDAYAARWTAKDPILFNGSLTNLYSYGAGDGVNRIDVTGLDYVRFSNSDGKLTWHADDGGTLAEFDAVSGPFDNGPLPSGPYDGNNLRRRSPTRRPTFNCGDEGPWSLDLDPQFTPNPYRDLLRIHPDAGPPGTAGCIGAACRDAGDLYRALDDYLNAQGNSSITVYVDD